MKPSLHDAPKKGRLLACTRLCRPLVQYLDTVWDSSLNQDIEKIEIIQNHKLIFISILNGRKSVTEASE